jgi:uncharacterized protein YndB with AHSA1/START domain
MLKKILIVLVVLVAAFVAAVFYQPAEHRYVNSITINAPPGVVFAHVNDLRQHEAWNPWGKKLDPAIKVTYSERSVGNGATMTWEGKKEVGAGTITIVDSRPDEFIQFKEEYRKPFAATGNMEFTFAPKSGQTLVTWTVYGKTPLVVRAVGMFIDMNKALGTMFGQGLADLKEAVENPPRK